MRTAPDGLQYSKQEFQQFFGGLDEWNAAAQSAVHKASKREPPPLPPKQQQQQSSTECRLALDGNQYSGANNGDSGPTMMIMCSQCGKAQPPEEFSNRQYRRKKKAVCVSCNRGSLGPMQPVGEACRHDGPKIDVAMLGLLSVDDDGDQLAMAMQRDRRKHQARALAMRLQDFLAEGYPEGLHCHSIGQAFYEPLEQSGERISEMGAAECSRLVRNWRWGPHQRGMQSFVAEFSTHLRLEGVHSQELRLCAQPSFGEVMPSSLQDIRHARAVGATVRTTDWSHMEREPRAAAIESARDASTRAFERTPRGGQPRLRPVHASTQIGQRTSRLAELAELTTPTEH